MCVAYKFNSRHHRWCVRTLNAALSIPLILLVYNYHTNIIPVYYKCVHTHIGTHRWVIVGEFHPQLQIIPPLPPQMCTLYVVSRIALFFLVLSSNR